MLRTWSYLCWGELGRGSSRRCNNRWQPWLKQQKGKQKQNTHTKVKSKQIQFEAHKWKKMAKWCNFLLVKNMIQHPFPWSSHAFGEIGHWDRAVFFLLKSSYKDASTRFSCLLTSVGKPDCSFFCCVFCTLKLPPFTYRTIWTGWRVAFRGCKPWRRPLLRRPVSANRRKRNKMWIINKRSQTAQNGCWPVFVLLLFCYLNGYGSLMDLPREGWCLHRFLMIEIACSVGRCCCSSFAVLTQTKPSHRGFFF